MQTNENDLERMVSQPNIDSGPNPAHRQSLRWQMLSVFNKPGRSPLRSKTTWQTIGRTAMRSSITKLTAAAVVIIAMMICVYHVRSNKQPVKIADLSKLVSTSAGRSVPELAPLDIKLPKPMFVGTEKDIRVPHLKPLAKSRPPFLAPVGTKNVAFERPVTSTDDFPIIGALEMITDGDKEAADGSFVELGPSRQSITIDLEVEYNVYAIVFWHWHKRPRVYFDVVVQVSSDVDFINTKTLFNNDIDNSEGLGVGEDMHYIETRLGKLIDAKGIKARHVRLHSNGNNSNDLNHYIEVEVYGMRTE